jgi:hypothetical protein
MSDTMTAALEVAITAAAVRALRHRAEAIRKRASVGVTVLDRGRQRSVIQITSESATSLKIAKSFADIADERRASTRRTVAALKDARPAPSRCPPRPDGRANVTAPA